MPSISPARRICRVTVMSSPRWFRDSAWMVVNQQNMNRTELQCRQRKSLPRTKSSSLFDRPSCVFPFLREADFLCPASCREEPPDPRGGDVPCNNPQWKPDHESRDLFLLRPRPFVWKAHRCTGAGSLLLPRLRGSAEVPVLYSDRVLTGPPLFREGKEFTLSELQGCFSPCPAS